MKKFLFVFSFIALLFIGCAEEFDINQFKSAKGGNNLGGDTVYIQLSPNWEGFNKPQDLLIGREPFIYVADTDNDRVVMMNLDGAFLGQVSIKKPIALAQDYKLNLFVIAKFDTTINGQPKEYSAVYKIHLAPASHQMASANVERILPRANDLNYPQRQYTGITCFYDNSYYISRTGPNNASFIDPDNSIIMFSQVGDNDTLTGRVAAIEPLGTGLISANGISSLNAFPRRNNDFIATFSGNNSFKVQWFTYVSTAEQSGYESKLSPASSEIMYVNRFGKPEGSTLDPSGNIYIADAGKDSIYKFNSFGEEMQSFGGPSIMKAPHAVGYFDRTLYIADTENNRIIRFILSTDLR